MDGFKSIRFKKSTVLRFRVFSKKMAKSYTDTLESIMDFFEWHGFNPSQKFTKSIIQEILKNRQRTETSIKRNEATIAIIRDIEVNQTKPNNAMLLSLFGANEKEEKPIRKEKKLLENKPEQNQEIEITVPKIRYERLAEKMENMTNDFDYVLSKVTVAKSSFGKEYLKLEISKAELEKFTRTLKNL
ncbi:BfmA/BtgA family mobilization protein [Flagellimonas onchidii]|uniref:BfmA/BtgA family mobilization protein n=1 Tax=Flagellimonas onchidii TaxID=2562684 RepID=UPI0028BD696C|nr:BfmA/BtgA family mobilization protein [Allomuricauda onchidii]